MKRHLGILFVALIFVFVSSTAATAEPKKPVGKPAPTEGCQPKATPKDDVIVCTGADTEGVDSGRGDDSITIETGATVRTTASDPKSQSIAVDGGKDNDTIINNGEVSVDVTSSGNTLKGIPARGTSKTAAEKRGAKHNNKKTAQGTGIAGGEGADVITNSGTISVTASSQAKPSTGSGPTTATASATGIAADGTKGRKQHKEKEDDDNWEDAAERDHRGHDREDDGRREHAGSSQLRGWLSRVADFWSPPWLRDLLSPGKGREGETIVNDGLVGVTATATVSGATAPVAAHTDATGIAGDKEKDTIVNNGTIAVTATTAVSGSSAAVTANAEATGIAGDKDKDRIVNNGSIVVTASSGAGVTGVSLNLVGTATEDARTEASGIATGIDGGKDRDLIDNLGPLKADARASATRFDLTANVIDAATADARLTANARGTGIAGGDGKDVIANGNVITVQAGATAVSASVELNLVDAAGGDVSTTALARATGIDGGKGKDLIGNAGSIAATASADTTVVGVNLSLTDFTIFAGAGSSGAMSEAMATGIDGGNQDDRIVSTGSIAATASADTDSTNVGVGSLGVPRAVQDLFEGTLADAGTTASAGATGIDGGDGKDVIANKGALNSSATATAVQVGVAVGVQIPNLPDALSLIPGSTIVGAGTEGNASATGIAGGRGNDAIRNEGAMAVSAGSDTKAVGVSADLPDPAALVSGGLTLGIVVADTATTSQATATGIAGGEGKDHIVNAATGTLVSSATADALSTGVSVSLAGISTGPAFIVTAPAARAETTAGASAMGITGGRDRDAIRNLGSVKANATSTATSVSVSAGIQTTATGVAAGVALADTSTNAEAAATGIDGGDGDDTLINTGTVASDTTSTATSVSVSRGAGITGTGVTVEGAVVDGSARGLANAAGLTGGNGSDDIHNQGAVNVTSTADVTTVGVSNPLSGTVTGLGISGALSRATTTAVANATAIAGDKFEIAIRDDGQVIETDTAGAGNDTIENHHAVTATANADADAASVSVAISLTGTGVQLGGALADLRNNAVARATGISGGAGDDTITNYASTTANSTATSGGASVSVAVQGAIQGVAVGGAYTNAATDANATSTAISGDGGNDNILNTAALGSSAVTRATASTVAVSAPLAIVPLGVGLADSSATADARAYGIAGGAGNDVIDNQGAITIGTVGAPEGGADARATGTSVAANVIGASIGDANSIARSTAIGIDGGAGEDIIGNTRGITVTAKSVSTGTSVTVGLVGASIGDARAEANASASGIVSGAGNDTVVNSGDITADAMADAAGTTVSANLVGASLGDVNTMATATAVGIASGAGNDAIRNTGVVKATAMTNAPATNVSVNTGIGASLGDAATSANATATGMDGSEGYDWIENTSSVTVVADAKTGATGVSVVLAGDSDADVGTRANATAIGIASGAGNDAVANRGMISATAKANARAASLSVNLAGAAFADSGTTAKATTTGLAGGDGSDKLVNESTIDAIADALTRSGSVGAVFAGLADGDVTTTANAAATGIAGNDGNDWILNKGAVSVKATSDAGASSVNVSLFGAADGDGNTTANAVSVGIDGGDGQDRIKTAVDSTLTVASAATTSASGHSFALAGAAAADGVLNARATSIGIAGGAGADKVLNEGSVDVDATSTSTVSDSTVTIFGSAQAGAKTTADAKATGIAGGDGDDGIVSLGTIDVDSNVTMTLGTSTFDFAGVASSSGVLTGRAQSSGIAGGAGRDWINNQNDIDVDARSTLTANSGTRAIFGSAGGAATTSADVTAIGIDGGNDEDYIKNSALIDVHSTATTTADRTAYAFTGSASVPAAVLTARSNATGISGGDGQDWIHNAGALSVAAQAQQTATGGVKATLAGGGESSAKSSAEATAIGVDGGSGDNTVINDGAIGVDANPTGTARNVAGGGFLFGTAGAKSELDLTSTGYGVVLGEGTNVLGNTGGIAVIARGDGLADAKADGGRLFNGSAFATATVSGRGLASGVQAGDGDNWIFNSGSLSVVVQPKLRADKADANGNGITNANGTASATASITGKAIGIEAGHGDNRITNNGLLSVGALPEAKAVAFADSDLAGTARATAIASASAEAGGIRAGNGNNQIVNNGTITVLAAPTATAEAQATADAISLCIPFTRICATIEIGNKIATSQSTESATAVGIATGSGDDIIVNNGTITATQVQNDVSSRGVAISSGAGNDRVTLGDGSFTTGHIELASGNDTFHLIGTPTVDGNIDSGSGTNSLIFEGTGSFSNPLVGFVNTLKQGAGTYTLPSLSTMQRLEVKEGTLQLNSNYTMGSGSTFQTIVNGDGSHGQLKVGGTAGLDGALVVDKGPGVYVDGTTYDIVSANTVSGSFASETLPAPTTLVSFSTNQLPAAFQVEASVAPFTSVTNNSVGFAVASALDSIRPNATGDMSGVLGSLQQLTQSDFNKIYSGISGESYDHFRASTFNVMRRYSGVMHSRMNQMRGAFRGMSILESADRTQMSQDSLLAQYGLVPGVLDLPDNTSAGLVLPRYGMWLSAFGQAAGEKGSDGYSSFNYQTTGVPFGFDFPLSNNLIVGFAAGQSISDIIRDQAVGRTDGAFSAIYGTYFTRNAHVEAVLSRGWNQYENKRVMDLGDERRVATSRHGGDAYSAALEARYRFDFAELKLEPFSSLHYSRLVEDGFRETGAGSLNLIVNKRAMESLSSQLGFRVVSAFSLDSGQFVPEFTAAWKHDFTADPRSITAAFSGAPDSPFTLQGKEVGREGLELGAALTFVGQKNFSVSAGFTTELGTNREEVSALLQVAYKW